MNLPSQILAPGSVVYLAGGVPAQVLHVLLSPGSALYHVAWWRDGCREEAEIQALEICDIGPVQIVHLSASPLAQQQQPPPPPPQESPSVPFRGPAGRGAGLQL